jgi:hypothetical protein
VIVAELPTVIESSCAFSAGLLGAAELGVQVVADGRSSNTISPSPELPTRATNRHTDRRRR